MFGVSLQINICTHGELTPEVCFHRHTAPGTRSMPHTPKEKVPISSGSSGSGENLAKCWYSNLSEQTEMAYFEKALESIESLGGGQIMWGEKTLFKKITIVGQQVGSVSTTPATKTEFRPGDSHGRRRELISP